MGPRNRNETWKSLLEGICFAKLWKKSLSLWPKYRHLILYEAEKLTGRTLAAEEDFVQAAKELHELHGCKKTLRIKGHHAKKKMRSKKQLQ